MGAQAMDLGEFDDFDAVWAHIRACATRDMEDGVPVPTVTGISRVFIEAVEEQHLLAKTPGGKTRKFRASEFEFQYDDLLYVGRCAGAYNAATKGLWLKYFSDVERDGSAVLWTSWCEEPEDHLALPPIPEEPFPERVKKKVVAFRRSQQVVDWVNSNAEGVCELCLADAPFTTKGGKPFLEVHHPWLLADGGPDVVQNAAALCPNCHRLLHHGAKRKKNLKRLYRRVDRLIKRKHWDDALA